MWPWQSSQTQSEVVVERGSKAREEWLLETYPWRGRILNSNDSSYRADQIGTAQVTSHCKECGTHRCYPPLAPSGTWKN